MILYQIWGLILGLVFFIACIKAYAMGLAHGKDIAKGVAPKMEVNPVKAVVDYKYERAAKKRNDEIAEGIHNILTYTQEQAYVSEE